MEGGRRGTRPPAQLISFRFDHVLLWVTDERAAFDFYSKTLGFRVLNDDNEKGLFTVRTSGGFVLSFHRKGVDEDGTGMSVERTGTANVHFDFHVPDVDRAYEVLRDRGVRFIRPPKDMPWGERHAWLSDPDGYVIGLSGPIPSPGRPPTREPPPKGTADIGSGESGAHD